MEFDYDAPSVPDSAVADVVGAIRNQGKLPPLTPEQIEQRKLDAQLHALACIERDEQFRLEWERKKAAEAEATRHQAAIAQAEAARKAQRERTERIEQETRRRQLNDLELRAAKQDWFQGAATNAIRQQQQQRIWDAEIERRKPILAALEYLAGGAPEPESEPEEDYEGRFFRPDWREEVQRGWEECSRRYKREQELKQLKSK
jgi:type IV secretory pathway VirB10-like protein